MEDICKKLLLSISEALSGKLEAELALLTDFASGGVESAEINNIFKKRREDIQNIKELSLALSRGTEVTPEIREEVRLSSLLAAADNKELLRFAEEIAEEVVREKVEVEGD